MARLGWQQSLSHQQGRNYHNRQIPMIPLSSVQDHGMININSSVSRQHNAAGQQNINQEERSDSRSFLTGHFLKFMLFLVGNGSFTLGCLFYLLSAFDFPLSYSFATAFFLGIALACCTIASNRIRCMACLCILELVTVPGQMGFVMFFGWILLTGPLHKLADAWKNWASHTVCMGMLLKNQNDRIQLEWIELMTEMTNGIMQNIKLLPETVETQFMKIPRSQTTIEHLRRVCQYQLSYSSNFCYKSLPIGFRECQLYCKEVSTLFCFLCEPWENMNVCKLYDALPICNALNPISGVHAFREGLLLFLNEVILNLSNLKYNGTIKHVVEQQINAIQFQKLNDDIQEYFENIFVWYQIVHFFMLILHLALLLYSSNMFYKRCVIQSKLKEPVSSVACCQDSGVKSVNKAVMMLKVALFISVCIVSVLVVAMEYFAESYINYTITNNRAMVTPKGFDFQSDILNDGFLLEKLTTLPPSFNHDFPRLYNLTDTFSQCMPMRSSSSVGGTFYGFLGLYSALTIIALLTDFAFDLRLQVFEYFFKDII